jgi:Mycothiol-dependent nitroreductase Rv2466c
VLGPLYSALAVRMHEQSRSGDPAVLGEALEEVGLPAGLAEAATTDEFDDVIKKSHHEAFDQVGIDVGVPVIRVGGKAYFGPVVVPAPKGEAAGRLWDGFVMLAGTDGFYEIKRSRDIRPPFDWA